VGEAGARLAGAVSAVWVWRAVGQVWGTAVGCGAELHDWPVFAVSTVGVFCGREEGGGGGVRKRPMAARVHSFFLDRFAVRVWGRVRKGIL